MIVSASADTVHVVAVSGGSVVVYRVKDEIIKQLKSVRISNDVT